MGWSFGWDSKQELREYLTVSREGFRTLRSTCKGNTLWALHESVRDGEPRVWIGCYLLKGTPGQSYDGWGYKGMSEEMGPCYYDCPVAYLALAPVADEAWRERVRECHTRQKTQRGKKPAEGETWTLQDATIPRVKIASVKPLRGTYRGNLYRIKRRLLGDRVNETETAAV